MIVISSRSDDRSNVENEENNHSNALGDGISPVGTRFTLDGLWWEEPTVYKQTSLPQNPLTASVSCQTSLPPSLTVHGTPSKSTFIATNTASYRMGVPVLE
jgi:hypothetical protein